MSSARPATLPRFNPISITGYHAREAGCDAIQELGAHACVGDRVLGGARRRGACDFDAFAPRLSFHFATTIDLFEEVAKLRAARRMWARIATERFGATDPNSARLRFFSGCSGATLTAQQPLNNIVRSTIQCLGAVLGGAQSIHVMGYDEAFEIPSEEAVTLSLRTQQIVALESGVTADRRPARRLVLRRGADRRDRARGPTDARGEIETLGGAVAALEQGVSQRGSRSRPTGSSSAIADGTRPCKSA